MSAGDKKTKTRLSIDKIETGTPKAKTICQPLVIAPNSRALPFSGNQKISGQIPTRDFSLFLSFGFEELRLRPMIVHLIRKELTWEIIYLRRVLKTSESIDEIQDREKTKFCNRQKSKD